MSIRWTRTSVRSFVWNLTRSLFHFTSLFKFPVARVVGTKPTPAEPRATPANTPKTAAPTIAALKFFLKRNTRIGSTSSPYFDRVVGQCPTPCNDRRKDGRKPWSSYTVVHTLPASQRRGILEASLAQDLPRGAVLDNAM